MMVSSLGSSLSVQEGLSAAELSRWGEELPFSRLDDEFIAMVARSVALAHRYGQKWEHLSRGVAALVTAGSGSADRTPASSPRGGIESVPWGVAVDL